MREQAYPAGITTRVLETASKVTITVQSGEMLFSPIKFNTFEVGDVTMSAEFNGSIPVEQIQQATQELNTLVREIFAQRYQQRLKFYIAAIKTNNRQISDAKESE